MAIALSRLDRYGQIGEIKGEFSVVFSVNYPTNGEAADFVPLMGWSVRDVKEVTFRFHSIPPGWDLVYDYLNKKILVFGYSPTDATAGVIARQQHAAAAYAAALTGATIRALVTCRK